MSRDRTRTYGDTVILRASDLEHLGEYVLDRMDRFAPHTPAT